MLRAHQLCSLSSHRPAQERASKRAEEAGASQESSTALQDAALCGILLSPSLLSKENDHFRPSFHQKIACGAPKNASSPCLTLVAGAARPESATPFQTIIPVSHEGESPSRARCSRSDDTFVHFLLLSARRSCARYPSTLPSKLGSILAYSLRRAR